MKARLGIFYFWFVFSALGPNSAFAQAAAAKVATVSVPILVTKEDGSILKDLSLSDFKISEKGRPVELSSLVDPGKPFGLGIVLDWSGSLAVSGKNDRRLGVLSELRELIKNLPADVDYTVAVVYQGRSVSVDANERDKVLSRLDELSSLKPEGNTCLYNAMSIVIEQLRQKRFPLRSLILITDGQDNTSKVKFSDVREILLHEDILVYGIDLNFEVSTMPGMLGEVVIGALTEESGGRVFKPFIPVKKVTPLAWGRVLADDISNVKFLKFNIELSGERPRKRKLKIVFSESGRQRFGKDYLLRTKNIIYL